MTAIPFQRVLDDHRDDVWRYLRGMVGAQAAEDCFQETFLAALRAYPRLRPDSNVSAWLLTIAHRKAIDHTRRRREVGLSAAPVLESVPAPERDTTIWSAVAALPPRQRASVLLRFGGDLPHRDIARVIGCSEAAARRSLHEGLKRLRETL
jgi:RNA polymerase sigma factor (sigma-70 family)